LLHTINNTPTVANYSFAGPMYLVDRNSSPAALKREIEGAGNRYSFDPVHHKYVDRTTGEVPYSVSEVVGSEKNGVYNMELSRNDDAVFKVEEASLSLEVGSAIHADNYALKQAIDRGQSTDRAFVDRNNRPRDDAHYEYTARGW